MKNFFLQFSSVSLVMLLLASCANYSISGTTDLQNIDGRKLFLRATQPQSVVSIDSCDVVHGKFKFSGSLDSIQVVMLCIEDMPVLPVVLEDGTINVLMNDMRQECTGTALNDSLTSFNNRYAELVSRIEDLGHQQNQGYMNGEDMDSLNIVLQRESEVLTQQEDEMITDFISQNFDNCLGPYVFQLATSSFKYPMLTPWIEALMTKATDTFKNSPYVKDYLSVAKENQDIMTGVK